MIRILGVVLVMAAALAANGESALGGAATGALAPMSGRHHRRRNVARRQ